MNSLGENRSKDNYCLDDSISVRFDFCRCKDPALGKEAGIYKLLIALDRLTSVGKLN